MEIEASAKTKKMAQDLASQTTTCDMIHLLDYALLWRASPTSPVDPLPIAMESAQ